MLQHTTTHTTTEITEIHKRLRGNWGPLALAYGSVEKPTQRFCNFNRRLISTENILFLAHGCRGDVEGVGIAVVRHKEGVVGEANYLDDFATLEGMKAE